MDDNTPKPPDGGISDDLVDQAAWGLLISEEVGRLREQIADLRASLASEVRTRRLVVEEPDGFERVLVEAHGFYGGIDVKSRARSGRSTSAGMFALDAGDGDAAQVGVALSDRGDLAATLDLYAGQAPRLWLGDRHSS